MAPNVERVLKSGVALGNFMIFWFKNFNKISFCPIKPFE
jgi:hypothetical protein